MWKRRVAATIWTKETMVGKSSILMYLGFLLSKACSVLCWELGLSSLPLPQVSIDSQIHKHNETLAC